MILIRLLSIFLLLSIESVYARMYQWTEPDTGTTQLNKDTGFVDKSLEELREIITEWEESQSEDAKQALQK